MVLGVSCKDPAPTPPPEKKILQLLEPSGTSNVKVGDKVTIKWTISNVDVITRILVELEKDSGASDPTVLGGGTFAWPDTSITWTVAAGDTGKNCYISIKDYNDYSINDQSKTFNIVP